MPAFLRLSSPAGLGTAELPTRRKQGTATRLVLDGQRQHLHWRNGDQTHQGRYVRLEPGRFVLHA